MADLVAQGPKPENRWRRRVTETPAEIGRTATGYATPWDRQISRVHMTVLMDGDDLVVEKNESAKNPILFGGKELERFRISAGEHFVIGQTTFTLSNERAMATLETPAPASEQAFSSLDIEKVQFSDSDRRLAVLNQLPDIIASAPSERDLYVRLASVLLTGIRSANTVAIVSCDNTEKIDVLHWDRRMFVGEDFQPSERLIRRAVDNDQTILHFWDRTISQISKLTVANENQWAFVSPLGGQACQQLAIYVLGNEADRGDYSTNRVSAEMQSDIKFCELVGKMVSSLRDVQLLERNQSALRTFFSPIVMDAFAGTSLSDSLEPRNCEISVLFCDLRGFSRTSEVFADNLLELLDRVSQALGITTQRILAENGVVGDFHGDAVMGFWGWPFEQSDRVARACRAAVEIEQQFELLQHESSHALSDFRIGIGIASGNAVAGRIGTSDQVKVTAFGPTVNMASRLEGLTKQLKLPILIDGRTAQAINADASSDICAVRVARIQPAGMAKTVDVSQLLSTQSAMKFDVVIYEHALQQFMDGDWDGAKKKLFELTTESGPAKFLQDYMTAYESPPEGFEGTIKIDRK